MTRLALISLLLSLPAFAADPFACVDPDVVEAFVNTYSDPPRYSTELPAEAAGLALPGSLKVVASMASGSHVRVVYKTGMDADTAVSSSVESLKRSGWEDAHAWHDTRGFHDGTMPRMVFLCQATEPVVLQLQSQTHAGHTLLDLSLYPQQDGLPCHDSGPARDDFPLHPYLPNLQVPEDAETRENGTGGGGDEFNASVVLSTTLSRDALLRYFDDQIRAQGWTSDSNWAGGMTAGTVWTRSGTDHRPLVGTMRIAEAAGGIFNARFTVISVAPANFRSGSSSSALSLGRRPEAP